MSAHDWYVENRSAFVSRSLERDEERTFIEHLMRCDECAREVARLEGDLAWLPMGVAPVAPKPGFARRIAGEILDRPRGWRRRLPALAAAAAVLLALGLGFHNGRERRELSRLLATRESRLTALEDTLSVLRQARQVVQTNVSMPGGGGGGAHQGGLLIFQDGSSHRWTVIVHGLPPAPDGNVYQFWFITRTGMVRSVEVNADSARPAFMTVPMPSPAIPVMGAALTMESMVNRSGEPAGVELAHVMF